jgi:hypothetical protein
MARFVLTSWRGARTAWGLVLLSWEFRVRAEELWALLEAES